MFRTVCLAAALAATAAAAPAATLDFSSFGLSQVDETSVNIDGATLSNSTGSFKFGAGPMVGNSVCAFDAASYCANDLTIEFDQAVTNLSFEPGFFDAGDLVSVVALRDGFLAGMTTIDSVGLVDLSGFGAITTLRLLDASAVSASVPGAGLSYGGFSFDIVAAPLPASVALLAAAFGVLTLIRRRR